MTTLVTCPSRFSCCGGKCGGEQVEARGLDDFASPTVTVEACSFLLAQGWTGPNVVLWKSQVGQAWPPTETTWQHAEGLVTFAGAR